MKASIFMLLLILATIVYIQLGNSVFTQNDPRSGFGAIKVQEFIFSNKIKDFTPKALAVQLFSNEEELEGRKSENISVAYLTRETAAIVHTVVGLADDSVGGIRHRIELKRTSNKWEIVWVGRQHSCYPGRGHQNWSSSPCV